jgi:hypothetical protein
MWADTDDEQDPYGLTGFDSLRPTFKGPDMENWKDVPGFEGRYQVSDLGRVRALSFMQRYLLRNGQEAFRRVRQRIRKPKLNNKGYLVISLQQDNVETMFLVHRLVAQAFVPGSGETVNHMDGVKRNNTAVNLEWATYTENHLHAVKLGLNTQAVRVVHPTTGEVFDSIAQAARASHVSHRKAATWSRA